MSRYEWERGTIVLPSAARTQVRTAVRTATIAHFDRVLACARTFVDRDAKRTRSAAKFEAALRAWQPSGLPDEVVTDAYRVLELLSSTPRMPRRADVAKVVPEVNSRTTSFGFVDFTIVFDGRDVTWAVPDNNHAVSTAHAHPVARAFFAELGRVRWTRGSGGTLVGNDEYNEESREAGGGANYVTASFGPARS
jgi:hypothetical protein